MPLNASYSCWRCKYFICGARRMGGQCLLVRMERMLDADYLLVVRAQRGDRAAFEELVRRTSRLVYARLYLETGDTHQTEDLVQETLLTAYRTLGQLTAPEKFRGWLLRIAQNLAINAIRHDARKKR